MDSRIHDRNVFSISQQGGVHLVGFFADAADGKEEESLDSYLDHLTSQGNRVIDSSLAVEVDSDPPVSGWILYEETAK